MRIKIASSTELHGQPWGAAHHFPGDVSDDARALVNLHHLLTAAHAQHPDLGTPDHWNAAFTLVERHIHRRATARPTTSTAARASVEADRAYFTHHGHDLPPHPGHRY